MRCETKKGETGFSVVELMVVVLVIFTLAAIAVPNILSAIHMAKLRGTASDFGSLLQTARIQAVRNDHYYSTYLLAGPPEQAYVDLTSNGGTGIVAGDPEMLVTSEVIPVLAANAPNTNNLKGQFLPAGSALPVQDGSTVGTPVIFSPRGLPCTTQTALGGNVCESAGGATAFWVFFQNNVTKAWEAVTVSPAGRIQKWQYGGTGWSKL